MAKRGPNRKTVLAGLKFKTFRVKMRGLAVMRGTLDIQARDEQEARDLSAERVGDVSWEYEGISHIWDSQTEVSRL